MKLIIEIPEEVYEKQRYLQYFGAWSVVLQKCFENGIPLPKGHGRLIDVIQLKASIFDLLGRTNGNYWDGVDDVGDLIDNAPTIIEADTGESEVSDAT